jgi:hypothetical protein
LTTLGAVVGTHLSTLSLTAIWTHKPAVQCMSSSVIYSYLFILPPHHASSGTVSGPPYACRAARSGRPLAPPLSPRALASRLIRRPSRQPLDRCTSTWGSPVAPVPSFAVPSTSRAASSSSARRHRLGAGIPELHWSERAVWGSPHRASRSRRRSAARRSLLAVLPMPHRAATPP